MTKTQLFSLMGLFVLMAGCGNQAQNPAAWNYGQGLTGGGYLGYNNGMYGGGTQTPLYNGSQLIGYKTRQPLLAGSYSNLAGPSFSQSVSVNAGDRIYINTSNASYGAYIRCDRRLIDTRQYSKPVRLTQIAVTLNGQNLGAGNGAIAAPAAGTLTVVANLDPTQIQCGFKGDRPFEVIAGTYYVNFSNPYSNFGGFYNGSTGAAVEREMCVNTANQPMACPY